ncbi:MAG: tRNA epoxyqueuosine(34) reductase QueG [Deltaproteobacteria bacterium]|nr:tRNA epoxyqueuosine(34) reductase QueG [Deltaproteobacteria bacterium]
MNINVSKLRERALELGFIKIGFSKPREPVFYEDYCSWISASKNAGMEWLEAGVDLRRNPSTLLAGCRTIISLAYPYPSKKPVTTDGFSVSRYSTPLEEDYHSRLRKICKELVKVIRNIDSSIKSRICVDSAPLLERSFAYSSGVGFIGKNNMLIIPGYGSFFYLAEILTTADLDFQSARPYVNQCGSCKRCVDSCPTGALEKPFLLNSSKCLSYLTIEHKHAVSADVGRRMGDCFFGCDRCQEVCPFNSFEQSIHVSLPSTEEFLKMTEEKFKERFGRTALARAGLDKIKNNICVLSID